MKSTFVLYTKYKKQVAMLDDAQAGTLFKAILAHESGEELPEMDGMTEMLYSIISEQLEYDAAKYEVTYQRNAENGKRGGRPKKVEDVETQENPKKGVGFFENPTKPTETQENPKKHDTDTESESDTVSESVTDTEKNKKREANRATRFTPPSKDEVTAYCRERGNKVDPETFMDFYASKGWKVGSQPMKDWRAAVRTWEKRDAKPRSPASPPVREYNRFEQRTYDYDDLKKKLLARGANG